MENQKEFSREVSCWSSANKFTAWAEGSGQLPLLHSFPLLPGHSPTPSIPHPGFRGSFRPRQVHDWGAQLAPLTRPKCQGLYNESQNWVPELGVRLLFLNKASAWVVGLPALSLARQALGSPPGGCLWPLRDSSLWFQMMTGRHCGKFFSYLPTLFSQRRWLSCTRGLLAQVWHTFFVGNQLSPGQCFLLFVKDLLYILCNPWAVFLAEAT